MTSVSYSIRNSKVLLLKKESTLSLRLSTGFKVKGCIAAISVKKIVREVLEGLRGQSAPGPDGVHPKVLN